MSYVAISGKRRSGKSTLANILQRRFGFYPVNLASPLKRLAMEHFDLTFAQVDGDLKEIVDDRYNMTPRQILIDMGQFYRSVNPAYWVDKLMNTCSNPWTSYVVADVRFQNELARLKERDALLVRLDRSEDLTGKNIDDPSETQLDHFNGWDLHIPAEKNVNVEDLYVVANQISEMLRVRG